MLIRRVLSSDRLADLIAPRQKKFTTHRALILHAAWLDQGCPHCPIFLTAASRRSLDRVSVPVWGIFLSEPLDIVASVGRYPADWLMSREPIRDRLATFTPVPCGTGGYAVSDAVSSACPPVTGRLLTCYAPFCRSPPEYCYPALPLDLHVLGLPLAFILSQDQTLLCIHNL